MGIFARYVFRQAFGALALILASLAGVVWIAVALKQLNLITSQGQDAWTFLIMTTLALPNLIALIAPIALLIATIHTLNRLNGDSELIVLTASGASPWTAARPVLLLAVIVGVGVSAVNHFGMPWSLRQLRSYVVEMRANLITQILQPGRFASPEKSLTLHIRDRSMDGELYGLLMHDARDPNQTLTYLAEQGQIVRQDNKSYLIMAKGHVLRKSGVNEPSQIIAFQSYVVDLDRFEPKETRVDLKPRERYYDELVKPAPDDLEFKSAPGQFRAELHERFATPLYPIAFVLIAFAFVGQARSTRQNRNETAVFAFGTAIVVRLLGFAANNLVVLRAEAVPVLYAIPICASLWALWMIRNNARVKKSWGIGDAITDLLSGFGQLFRRRRPA